MPVSSTATTAPAPVNVEASAPTAAMPHAGVASAAGSATGSIRRVGIAGDIATTV